MIVVSDTSPLTYLHQIERFALLRSLYGEVVIPPAVERELRFTQMIREIHVMIDNCRALCGE